MDVSQKKQSIKNISERSTLILNDREGTPVKKVERYCLDSGISSTKTANDRSTLIVEPPPEVKSKSEHNSALNKQLLQYFQSLNKEKLWQELFNRLLKGKIGRLYFKSDRDCGSVFCFENGIEQLSIDNLKLDSYQYLIKKLKNLINLPATPVEKTKKFEVRRSYKKEIILLCLQLGPGKFAEEGTLQVLRGKALEFYQQQQMEELGQEALKLSKQLERKLKQIQLRSRINPQPLNSLTELIEIQQKIARNLTAIELKINS